LPALRHHNRNKKAQTVLRVSLGLFTTLLAAAPGQGRSEQQRDETCRLFKITASFNGSNTIIGLRDHRRKGR
jgi:hypothetical protein